MRLCSVTVRSVWRHCSVTICSEWHHCSVTKHSVWHSSVTMHSVCHHCSITIHSVWHHSSIAGLCVCVFFLRSHWVCRAGPVQSAQPLHTPHVPRARGWRQARQPDRETEARSVVFTYPYLASCCSVQTFNGHLFTVCVCCSEQYSLTANILVQKWLTAVIRLWCGVQLKPISTFTVRLCGCKKLQITGCSV